jgi:hypothetical protein
MTFPRVDDPSPQLAVAVTDMVWPSVMLQWEWLGGPPPLRRTAAPAAPRAAIARATVRAA